MSMLRWFAVCSGALLLSSCGGEPVADLGEVCTGPRCEMVTAPETPAPETPAPETPAPETPAGGCVPPPLWTLDEIPDDPTLDNGNSDTVAIFEVNGHDLVGKFVRDRAAAEGGLKLWQEVMLRIPANQLLDLVQLDIYLDTDPVAYFNRNGNVTTQRTGLKIGFSTRNFTLNDPDPCAPLEPRRGTFDWSLVHEFGHLRGWVDQSWDRFLTTFPDVRGDGEGYPADGSPVLTGDFVTSYAERDDGDEDYAETWTTFVMLPDDAIPPETAGEPLVLKKLRWVASQPGLAELRKAIRITEPGGGSENVAPAPRLADRTDVDDPGEPSVGEVSSPDFLHGSWGVQRDGPDGPYEHRFTFTADDVVETRIENGVEVFRRSLRELKAQGQMRWFVINLQTTNGFGYNASIPPDHVNTPLEDSFFRDDDPPAPLVPPLVYWTRLGSHHDLVLEPIP